MKTDKIKRRKKAENEMFIDINMSIKSVPDKDRNTNVISVSTKDENTILEMMTAIELAKKALNKFTEEVFKKNNLSTKEELEHLLNTRIKNFII